MSEVRDRGLSVTIKYGKGYEETWAVFTGPVAAVREDICDFFGVDKGSVAELTVSELVVNVTNLAHGKGNVAAMLGGVVIPKSEQAKPETTNGDPWADEPAEKPAAEPEGPNPVVALIEATTTITELQRVWAGNQPAFKDADVMAAYKARGKALQTAANDNG